MTNRFTCGVKCPSCLRCFKSTRTTLIHAHGKHHLTLDRRSLNFHDGSGDVVALPEPKEISSSSLDAYKGWIASLAERISESLHPALPGKWCRIKDAFCPNDLFEHLYELQEQNTEFAAHSITFLPHRKLPYRSRTVKTSYKMYDIRLMTEILDKEEGIQVKTQETFCGGSGIPICGSMKERKAMARASGLAGFSNSLQKRPTSISKVVCQDTAGRATRELELIWWPNLLKASNCGKFQLRFFIPKTSL